MLVPPMYILWKLDRLEREGKNYFFYDLFDYFYSYIVIKGRPCKVADVSTSKTGKHGHAKCNFTAIDIFTNKKLEDIIPSTHNTNVPNVSRTEYSLMDISEDDFCTLLLEDGTTRADIKLPDIPEGYGRELREAFNSGKSLQVSVMSAMGHEQIIAHKEETA